MKKNVLSAPAHNIVNIKPTYEVSVGAFFVCHIKNRTNTEIEYDNIITRLDVIRQIGVTPVVAEQEIWASGVLFDYINQITGANIALTAVALPQEMLNRLSGAKTNGGFVINRVSDLEGEFACGYWGENRNGTLQFRWHPVCKLIPGEDSKSTRTNDPTDPQKNYNIKIIPFGAGEDSGIWRVMYDQNLAKQGGFTPIGINDFFAQPIYKESQVDALIAGKTNIPLQPEQPESPGV